MSFFLNNVDITNQFIKTTRKKYFVDKTRLIEEINQLVCEADQFVCITRPRRFGKSINAAMLASYYAKNLDTKDLFDKLNISQCESYEKHLNKHNVVYISLNAGGGKFKSYAEYRDYFEIRLMKDLQDLYPKMDPIFTIAEMFDYAYKKTGEGFIFIIDEWDYIHTNKLFTSDERANFSEFLTDLLKDKSYVELAYMTGVLPIAKYPSGSSLNMFAQYDALEDLKYGDYFGFTQSEVAYLCSKQDVVSIDELTEWYDGYLNRKGDHIYNPMSVCKALDNGGCQNYWGNTVPLNEITEFVVHDIDDIRGYILRLAAGEIIEMELFGYNSESPNVITKNTILSLMVIGGFLAYHKKQIFIPNKEVMKKFETLLLTPEMGNISRVLEKSKDLLKATVNQDADTVAKLIDEAHSINSSYFEYSNENTLACVISIVYFAAKDTYNIKKEDTTGKGRTDFTFFPLNPMDTAFILELKTSGSVEEALEQIKSRNYKTTLAAYGGKKLAVAIYCDKDAKDKKHSVIIEELE